MDDASDPAVEADAFVEDALAALARSVEDRDGPFRMLQFATVSPEARPGLRTVVIRALERGAGAPTLTVEFHTDRLAGKVRELAFSPNAALLGWSAALALQLRLDGRASVHAGDALARARWDALSPNARAAYGFAVPPATAIGDPDAPPRRERDEDRFARFAVIRFETAVIDVLSLDGSAGQRRAIRGARPGAAAAWVCP